MIIYIKMSVYKTHTFFICAFTIFNSSFTIFSSAIVYKRMLNHSMPAEFINNDCAKVI